MTYGGYLVPWVGEIVRQYQAGCTPEDIADRLRPRVREMYPYEPYRYGPRRENIIYVLRRSGIEIPPAPPSPSFLKREAERVTRQRKRIAEWLASPSTPEWLVSLSTPSKPTSGRPLDMGGPRDIWIDRSPWDDR